MDKQKELEKLKKEIKEDDSLPLQESNLVFGEGSPDADVLFIGEAPGFHEDKKGKPFVGRAGKLLTKMIEAIDWKREEVYITNIVKRRPPNNRDPKENEINLYKPYLRKEIDIIDPKVIAPLGRFAMNYFLPDKKISKSQGKAFWLKERIIFPIYHPAAGLRNGKFLNNIKECFKKLQKVIENYDKLLDKKDHSKVIKNPEEQSLL
ncbi:MAG TPA: uracil-DNA glycosylase [Candidatus Paceibacterota bacterium]|nr:uracil-DNA glycosylase [Candidatus Paceibacterota bacterium]